MTAETSKKKATPKVAAPAAPKAAAVKTPVKAAAKKVAAQPKAAAAPAVSPARSPARSASTQPLAAASTAAKPTSTKAMPSTISAPTAAVLKRDPKLANNWKTKSAEELSDAEVIAMPDEEYMNDKQMAFFRHKLVQLKQDMHNNAGETAENLREDTVVVPDPADRATIEEEHALELRTRDRERKLLKKIEQSIARIDAGDYGYCDETGEPIGVGRLLARPTATLSLEAQQRRELKQKMFGD
ncbi:MULTISPECIES: RNA polymerase-binding protein DksA [Comamonas]|uniref:RNA polymerase-binding transcription factor DksA n=2 Tax=Comamonas TaxID=283 RepID=A0A2A7UZE7_COMTR|nr:RNA polymerase-binding protein DksA [Comamonas terrigena]MBD9531738.1 RNA polymerase-binding protein DksA [Comamonas sp. CMM01]PEH90709.1 RNA polymerase-binding protein DksA [Comamonas terrigena]SUY70330.1 DnaK suppressor protein [Comamonas terrigena]